MPTNYPNPYRDYRPLAAGLSASIDNISKALLMAPEMESKRALNDAHREAYLATAGNQRASAALREAEVKEKQGQMSTQANYVQELARSLLGDANGTQAVRHMRGEKDMLPAYEDEAAQMTMAPRAVPVAAPDGLTPEVRRSLEEAARIAVMLRAGGGNIEQIAKASNLVGDQMLQNDMVGGRVSPTTYLQANGKMPFKVDGDTVINTATGDLGKTTDLGKSRIEENRATTKLRGAQAGEASARAGAANRSNQIVEVPNPLDPNGPKIKVGTNVVFQEAGRNTRAEDANQTRVDIAGAKGGKDGATEKTWGMSAGQIKALKENIKGDIRSTLGIDDENVAVPDDLVNDVLASMDSMVSKPNGMYYKQPSAALPVALKAVMSERGVKNDKGWLGGSSIKSNPRSEQPAQQPQQSAAPAKKTSIPSMDEWINAARKANPKATDKELRDYYMTKYGSA